MDGGMPNSFSDISKRPISELEAEITELAGHLNAANHRWLTLLAEFDNRKGWNDCASQSCAHWLNWKLGITLGAAREKVRVAHALEKLPRISESMAKGELSYYKVRELTRVASPATEDTLLMIAQHGSAHHVETVVRQFRRASEAEELSREAQQQNDRQLSYHYDDDGSLVLKARLPPEAAAVFVKALEIAGEEVYASWSDSQTAEESEDVPYGTSTVKLPPRQKRADALTLMAESFLAHGAEQMNGGDKHQIIVHVSSDHLASEFEDGPSIASETARRMSCDCSVVRITEDGEGNPLDVGRKTRSIPPALKRALNSRDKGCRFPGCCNKKYTDGHHIEHWVNGGETKLTNLVTLCRFHHHLVHEGGLQVQILDDGAFRFVDRRGEPFSDNAPMSGNRNELLSFLSAVQRASVVKPAQWRGDRMNYDQALSILSQQQRRGGNVPAGTC